MAGITFTVELEASAARQLDRLVERMERANGFYKNVGEYLTGVAIPRNFAAESAPDGSHWAPLSALTTARREAAGQTPIQILRATGKMAAEINAEATDDYLRVGSPAPQAAVMQFGAAQGSFGSSSRGGPIPWGDIPGRPFLGLSPDDEIEIIAIAEDWLSAE
ncbi:phage virion morphogenesis protein [Fuscovulum blasticum]|uniref:phage virion morphogenesis protein n=1 Tax=Fuscovulum blasticum TaxID=1075 RepID=UPI000D3E1848|nr:phage virion morphogenesis protein [Fuscovulum blasticum]AWD21607.1 phage virion morphogenesis protein [Fuscovulum blasticum]